MPLHYGFDQTLSSNQKNWEVVLWWQDYEREMFYSFFRVGRLRDKNYVLWTWNMPIPKGYDGVVTQNEEDDYLARLVMPTSLDIIYKPKLLCPER